MPPARNTRDVAPQVGRDPPVDHDIANQITEIKREIRMREFKYPEWVKTRRLDEAEARTRMNRIRGALGTLQAEQRKRTPEFGW